MQKYPFHPSFFYSHEFYNEKCFDDKFNIFFNFQKFNFINLGYEIFNLQSAFQRIVSIVKFSKNLKNHFNNLFIDLCVPNQFMYDTKFTYPNKEKDKQPSHSFNVKLLFNQAEIQVEDTEEEISIIQKFFQAYIRYYSKLHVNAFSRFSKHFIVYSELNFNKDLLSFQFYPTVDCEKFFARLGSEYLLSKTENLLSLPFLFGLNVLPRWAFYLKVPNLSLNLKEAWKLKEPILLLFGCNFTDIKIINGNYLPFFLLNTDISFRIEAGNNDLTFTKFFIQGSIILTNRYFKFGFLENSESQIKSRLEINAFKWLSALCLIECDFKNMANKENEKNIKFGGYIELKPFEFF